MIPMSLQWKAVSQRRPIAASTPRGGTTTATRVTTWLVLLVPALTVARAAEGSRDGTAPAATGKAAAGTVPEVAEGAEASVMVVCDRYCCGQQEDLCGLQ
jgi:hypothetical protein